MEKIKLGISACLLGEPVRYDGNHKLDRFLKDTLGQYVDYVPVCPEVECGLGTPRESMKFQPSPERTHRPLCNPPAPSMSNRNFRGVGGTGEEELRLNALLCGRQSEAGSVHRRTRWNFH